MAYTESMVEWDFGGLLASPDQALKEYGLARLKTCDEGGSC